VRIWKSKKIILAERIAPGNARRVAAVREGRGLAGNAVFAGASKQILLMKWAYDIKPTGSETTDILSDVS